MSSSKVAIPAFYSLTGSTRTNYSHTIAVHCPNPKHDDHNPSCVFHTAEGNFRCLSCGIKGQLQDFVMLSEMKLLKKEIDELQALRKIARILNDRLDQSDIEEIEKSTGLEYIPHHSHTDKIIALTPQQALDRAKRFFETIPQTHWERIKFHYMQDERQFPNRFLQKLDVRLNAASIWPVTLPIFQQFEFMGYNSRLAREPREDESKYKNNTGFVKSKVVGGNLRKGTVLLVEGWLDLMRAILYGFPNVACTFGWYCSDEQAAHILQFADAIIVGYDNDIKGEQGYQRAKTCFASLGEQNIYRMKFPEKTKDIDTMESQWFNTELMLSGFQTIICEPETIIKPEKPYEINPIVNENTRETSRDAFIIDQYIQFNVDAKESQTEKELVLAWV